MIAGKDFCKQVLILLALLITTFNSFAQSRSLIRSFLFTLFWPIEYGGGARPEKQDSVCS